uniref:Putative gamma-secretase subunit APH-1C n=1 Tax=Lygus hesperus TaxID=30085 RepID=A0A0A9YX66_LYGHE
MAFMEFTGCALTAYSPALALFLFTISHDPVRIIIMVSSAFFWLLALVVSSLFWNYITFGHLLPLCIVFSVIVQEFFRFCFYKLMSKAKYGLRSLRVPNTNMDLLKNPYLVPYVAGLGYGVMSGAFSLFNVLAALSGPATVGFPNPETGEVPSNYFAFFSAIFTMLFTLLHVAWSIMFFLAAERNMWLPMGFVVTSHVIVSLSTTIFNPIGLYYVSIPIALIILAISCYWPHYLSTHPPIN